ncbi:ribosomal protein S18-alanine N-acetyltransferase [Arthrobacter sp. NPDC093139]|uniref:ribosomal protein S18-alanine N-acetyltransferase n=1 Tax=Arthrobacter sp. NPDC093139 TaxID=3363945 RepID=UPI00382B66E6
MVPADIPAVHALEVRLFPVDAWPLEMFVNELSQPETRRYLVAEAADGIVGYAGLMCIEPVADVQTIAVVPEYEGRGIGTALLTELISEGRRRGAADVLLEVRADNPRAQQLYRRFGFEQIHVRRRYYRDGVDALIMRLELADVMAVHQDIVHGDTVHGEAGQSGSGQHDAGQHAQTTPTEADQQ